MELTDREAWALDELENMHRIFMKSKKFISADGCDYIQRYMEFGLQLFDTGTFAPGRERELEKGPWSVFNFRHGPHSIRGTAGEILSAAAWNKQFFATTLHLNDGERECEMDGGDLFARNSNWKKQYPAQVKSAKRSVTIKIRGSWHDYEDLDRFIIANVIDDGAVYLGNYSKFKNNPLYRTGNFISFDELMADESLKPLRFKL